MNNAKRARPPQKKIDKLLKLISEGLSTERAAESIGISASTATHLVSVLVPQGVRKLRLEYAEKN
jgi:response regulator of citrate/malate metabolism